MKGMHYGKGGKQAGTHKGGKKDVFTSATGKMKHPRSWKAAGANVTGSRLNDRKLGGGMKYGKGKGYGSMKGGKYGGMSESKY